ncbi:hypothetical protein SAY86_011726 [Trapa natans]|uniref:Uncharacterized protein n=1 Tax=Trapa natans TaxID=22666 RepID=A0AAN7R6P3_TRANT|nr:hypothetical protein SAY86_011726 [Trapa natans]
MRKTPSFLNAEMNKGAWTALEDKILVDYVAAHGEGKWGRIPRVSGLKRSGKSCRLRWLNYLRPDIKRGNISPDEEDLIVRLHKLLGNRWSLIAGRLPGRTDNEIKNYWNTVLKKKLKVQKNPRDDHCKNPPAKTTGAARSSDVATVKPAMAGVGALAIPDLGLNGENSSDSFSGERIWSEELRNQAIDFSTELLDTDFNQSDLWKLLQTENEFDMEQLQLPLLSSEELLPITTTLSHEEGH